MNQERIIKAGKIIALLVLVANGLSILFVLFLTPVLSIATSELLLSRVNGTIPQVSMVAKFLYVWAIRWLFVLNAIVLYFIFKRWGKLRNG